MRKDLILVFKDSNFESGLFLSNQGPGGGTLKDSWNEGQPQELPGGPNPAHLPFQVNSRQGRVLN